MKMLTLTLAILITGCSATPAKTLVNELTEAESLISKCEAEQGEKCYLAALTPSMVQYIQNAIEYYEAHEGEKWL